MFLKLFSTLSLKSFINLGYTILNAQYKFPLKNKLRNRTLNFPFKVLIIKKKILMIPFFIFSRPVSINSLKKKNYA